MGGGEIQFLKTILYFNLNLTKRVAFNPKIIENSFDWHIILDAFAYSKELNLLEIKAEIHTNYLFKLIETKTTSMKKILDLNLNF